MTKLAAFPLFIFLLSSGFGQSIRPTGTEKSFDHNGTTRSYRIHLPRSLADSEAKTPLVICLHGGGSDAATISKSGWTTLADKESFIIVYPEGLNRHWNDGRQVKKHAAQNAVIDDVDFLMNLLNEISETHPVDTSRIYVLGLSNGGFMTQRLAIEHTERFAAISVQIASLPSTYIDGPLEFSPKAPLSVLFMNGTEDTFMPYEGGKLTPNMTPRLIKSETHDFGQGSATPVTEAVALWVEHNQLDIEACQITELPDLDVADGCRIIHHRWGDKEKNIAIELYEVRGGGHTIPGGAQYLPARIIGPVCRDLSGIEATWEFFESKRR
ncbi:MAG: PHB depolymerase family esterase [Verrucomicrobiales bacterium]|nr:PHB depolymerase family esterase [Verrucomicrobiales bacterium]